MDAFALYFIKLNDLVPDMMQMALNWLTKYPRSELVPLLSWGRKRLVIAKNQCNLTSCMEGAYNWTFPYENARTVTGKKRASRKVHLSTPFYDAKRISIDYFNEMYRASFQPWTTDGPLTTAPTVRVPPIQSDQSELGKQGVKPGPKPKHKRKKQKMAIELE
ncbi:Hypothetical protein PHPALM_6627 [Phytophthora palmivora]|uniref:Uncharacterized protein n=1 Tax=Phytophthora palmivora TaxID=4796 RepID=A0A2P4YEC0_9STRA|nr:Hypothetical protein PHPALM_6627 [Phytophthora palmivora]